MEEKVPGPQVGWGVREVEVSSTASQTHHIFIVLGAACTCGILLDARRILGMRPRAHHGTLLSLEAFDEKRQCTMGSDIAIHIHSGTCYVLGTLQEHHPFISAHFLDILSLDSLLITAFCAPCLKILSGLRLWHMLKVDVQDWWQKKAILY